MSERYIRRVALGPQQFPLNCPVKLAAGALLEDTKQPRLVAQLKFSGTRSTVTALAVTLHCQGRADTDLLFHYKALSAAPGQAFGQYTAIVLPEGTTDFQVTVEEVVLKNGAVWNRPGPGAGTSPAGRGGPPGSPTPSGQARGGGKSSRRESGRRGKTRPEAGGSPAESGTETGCAGSPRRF